MQAVVFHGIGDIRVEDVPKPKLEHPTDAIVRLTATAICGTDLHMIRGTMPGLEPGTILGHEGVGIVEAVGERVHNLDVGERVVIPSTIGCGFCAYCRSGYYAQCDNANPNGKRAGTAFFGGPKANGAFDGLQAEFARIPFANIGLVKLPDTVSDDQAIMISDIFPTGYFGAEIAEVGDGDTVAVFGCGPVGQFAIASALLLGAGRVFAVDGISSRLDMARKQGAEAIDFTRDDPVDAILELTGGIGVDRVIDAVGVDAERPQQGPVADKLREYEERFAAERQQLVGSKQPGGKDWQPGSAPSLALEWCVRSVCKAGSVGIVGVYPPPMETFPIGLAMNRNLTVKMGNCNHREYVPQLVRRVAAGEVDPRSVLTHVEPLSFALDAYKAFDQRQPGWMKVELLASGKTAGAEAFQPVG